MLAIDVSTSMLAEDLKPNRLEAAKDVAAEFINGRPKNNHLRLCLTIFQSGYCICYSHTYCCTIFDKATFDIMNHIQ